MYDFQNSFEFYQIQDLNYNLELFFEHLNIVSSEDLEILTHIKKIS